MSKINVQEVLMQKGKESQYAIVEDGERIIPTYFKRGDKEYIQNMIMGQFLYEINMFLFKEF